MESRKCRRVWITSDWEPNSLQGDAGHLGRMCSLSKYLSEQGYEVTLWFTTFNHPGKYYLYDKTTILTPSENEKIVLLHSKISYRKNVSPTRFLYHRILANEMRKMIQDKKQFPVPDLIFCSYPTEQFCRVALDYGKKHDVPIIMDARDQWPDIFERAFPTPLKTAARLVLKPMKRKTARDFAEATAICSMSPIMLNWALRYANRNKQSLDRHVFIGSKAPDMPNEVLQIELEKWREQGITENTWNICIFSTLSRTAVDVDTVIEAVRITHERHPEIRLIIGGKGDDEIRLRQLSEKYSFVHMMGWMNEYQMNSLMSISKAGMLCYQNTPDFKDGWGNKVGQYLSYGLPLLTSADGYAKTYVEQYECGMAYKEYDAKELADILSGLINNPVEQKRLADNARDRFRKEFDEQVVMKQFENMIHEVYDKFNMRG